MALVVQGQGATRSPAPSTPRPALGAVRQCGSGRSLGRGPPSLYGPGLRRPLRRVRSNSNPAAPSSPEHPATPSPDRQHRFRWETTCAPGPALRAFCAPAPGTTLGQNDRPQAFPDRHPEIQNYPLGVTSTPVFGNISPVLAAAALTRPAIRTKSRSPNMRVLTQPLTTVRPKRVIHALGIGSVLSMVPVTSASASLTRVGLGFPEVRGWVPELHRRKRVVPLRMAGSF